MDEETEQIQQKQIFKTVVVTNTEPLADDSQNINVIKSSVTDGKNTLVVVDDHFIKRGEPKTDDKKN